MTNEGIIYGHSRPSVALTDPNRQLLQVVPWTSHSALVLSPLAPLVTLEVENSSPTTATTLIHHIPTVPWHYLALWVVPLYCIGRWSCGLHTVHSIPPPDSERHVRCWAAQASAAIQQDSSRDCTVRGVKGTAKTEGWSDTNTCCVPRACACKIVRSYQTNNLVTKHHWSLDLASVKCSHSLSDFH